MDAFLSENTKPEMMTMLWSTLRMWAMDFSRSCSTMVLLLPMMLPMDNASQSCRNMTWSGMSFQIWGGGTGVASWLGARESFSILSLSFSLSRTLKALALLTRRKGSVGVVNIKNIYLYNLFGGLLVHQRSCCRLVCRVRRIELSLLCAQVRDRLRKWPIYIYIYVQTSLTLGFKKQVN